MNDNEDSWAENRTPEENEKILIQENRSLTAELTDLQRLIKVKHEEIRHLYEKITDLECQVDEAVCFRESEKKFLRERKQREFDAVQMKLHDLQKKEKFLLDENNRIAAELMEVKRQTDKLKEENLELRDQLSLLQKEKILADSEMRNPAAEAPPNSGLGFYKCLIVGLGIAVGGLMIFLAS